MRIDLHTHSTISDGTQSPAALAEAAAEAGLDVFALTDHDSAAGWSEASRRAEQLGLGFVPGMEVSCCSAEGISVHVLAYYPDPEAPGLAAEIQKARTARLTRAQRMVQRLSEDFPIDWEQVQRFVGPGATVGRPHIADAMVVAGVVEDRSEAFASILTGGSKYYIPHYAPAPEHAVRLIREAGGVPIFAHPLATVRGRVVGWETIEAMVEAGLAGLEIHHRDHDETARRSLTAFARQHDLLITGSSDYHGTGKPNLLGEHTTDPEVLEQIRAQALFHDGRR